MREFMGMKLRDMSPLQQQVYEKNICAQCHKKSMRFVNSTGEFEFWQCHKCKQIAVLRAASDGDKSK